MPQQQRRCRGFPRGEPSDSGCCGCITGSSSSSGGGSASAARRGPQRRRPRTHLQAVGAFHALPLRRLDGGVHLLKPGPRLRVHRGAQLLRLRGECVATTLRLLELHHQHDVVRGELRDVLQHAENTSACRALLLRHLRGGGGGGWRSLASSINTLKRAPSSPHPQTDTMHPGTAASPGDPARSSPVRTHETEGMSAVGQDWTGLDGEVLMPAKCTRD